MRILITEIFMLGIFNLACYFALYATGNIKRYLKAIYPIIIFGNILIGLAIPVLGFGVLAK